MARFRPNHYYYVLSIGHAAIMPLVDQYPHRNPYASSTLVLDRLDLYLGLPYPPPAASEVEREITTKCLGGRLLTDHDLHGSIKSEQNYQFLLHLIFQFQIVKSPLVCRL
jgi:hypothetical protein